MERQLKRRIIQDDLFNFEPTAIEIEFGMFLDGPEVPDVTQDLDDPMVDAQNAAMFNQDTNQFVPDGGILGGTSG